MISIISAIRVTENQGPASISIIMIYYSLVMEVIKIDRKCTGINGTIEPLNVNIR